MCLAHSLGALVSSLALRECGHYPVPGTSYTWRVGLLLLLLFRALENSFDVYETRCETNSIGQALKKRILKRLLRDYGRVS